ncbi:MAG TPA: hypothetical protein VGS57_22290 [Thermoanaerobaculia bacterium]|jgi:hypothetical protein|nr:hypothetical protein [Thermoanaerobaculia bacterium]
MSPARRARARDGKKRGEITAPVPLQLAAVGLEAEFELWLDGQRERPEDVFSSPRDIIRGELMHRRGTSYHLPTGGAVYFDTGVIEVATPVIELERGCAARAGRSLWEGILFLRRELDAWQAKAKRDARLVGFSTHYNVSFHAPAVEAGEATVSAERRTVQQLALLLTYLLPAPVMLLATNRESTGVGVRPRGERIEVTADFTPSSSLMIAAATVVVGIAREVMRWPSYELEELEARGFPVVRGFKPRRHTSRKGWLARFDCYPKNPFTCGPDEEVWEVEESFWRRRGEAPRPLSLRRIAEEVVLRFRLGIRRVSDPFTLRLIDSILSGHAPALLDLPLRPPAYEDAGRPGAWDNLFTERQLARSRYERVLIRAISGRKLWVDGSAYTPVAMRGWSQVVFRREPDGGRQVMSIDQLLAHLEDWERTSERQARSRQRM